MFSLLASMERMCLDFIDAARAQFHATARREVYVELSKEDSEEGKSGLLKKAVYGTSDAAQNWAAEYTDMLSEWVRPRKAQCMRFSITSKRKSE
jgi:hypothetical protein